MIFCCSVTAAVTSRSHLYNITTPAPSLNFCKKLQLNLLAVKTSLVYLNICVVRLLCVLTMLRTNKRFWFAVCRLASVLVWKWKAARADIFSNSVTALQLQLQEAIKNQKITNCWSDCPKTHIFTHKVVYGTSELKQKRPDTSWQDRNGALRQKQLVWLRNVCACECALSWQDKAK